MRRKRKQRPLVGLAVLALVALAAVYAGFDWFSSAMKQQAAPASTEAPATGGAKQSGNAEEEPAEPDIPVEKVDIVVFGSELEGLYLARAAADEGLKVKVLDTREAFGGQVLQGEMLFLDETRDDQRRSLVQGRAKELFDGFRAGKIRKLSEFEQYFDKLIQGIPVEQGVKLESVEQVQGLFAAHEVRSVL